MTKVLTIACVMLAVSAAAATGASGCAAREGRTAETRDEVLKARVESALGSASDVHIGGLTVGVTHGVVTLSGHVASGTEQQSVGAIVRAIPGVKDVFFALTIGPPASAAGPGVHP